MFLNVSVELRYVRELEPTALHLALVISLVKLTTASLLILSQSLCVLQLLLTLMFVSRLEYSHDQIINSGM